MIGIAVVDVDWLMWLVMQWFELMDWAIGLVDTGVDVVVWGVGVGFVG